MRRLVGAVTNDDEIIIEKSPVNKASCVKCPVILFHGDQDSIVPMSQTISFYNSIVAVNKIKCDKIIFENEGHHFQNPENTRHSLQKELKFYLHETVYHA